MLNKGRLVKAGLVGVIIFIVGDNAVEHPAIPWPGLAVAAAYLLRRAYPTVAVVDFVSAYT